MAYLWGWLASIGGLGKGLSWQEIKAWSELSGIEPNYDECQTMIRMANVWANEYAKGNQKGANVPLIAQEFIEW